MNSLSMSGLLTTKSQIAVSLIVCTILILPSLICLAPMGDYADRTSWKELTLATFGLLVGQGASTDDVILSKRILWITTLAFAVLISNILLGSLTASLSVKVQDMKIDSFQAAFEHDFELIFRTKSMFLEEYHNPKSDPFLHRLRTFSGAAWRISKQQNWPLSSLSDA